MKKTLATIAIVIACTGCRSIQHVSADGSKTSIRTVFVSTSLEGLQFGTNGLVIDKLNYSGDADTLEAVARGAAAGAAGKPLTPEPEAEP